MTARLAAQLAAVESRRGFSLPSFKVASYSKTPNRAKSKKEEPSLKPSVSTPEPELDATFDHIFEYWPVLTRNCDSLAYPLSGRFVKPGGFFKWFFYWDSYFTLLGLVVQGRWQLAREIVEGFVAEVEEFGLVPNYNGAESVCSSRSQSPFLTSAIKEVFPSINDLAWLDRTASAAATEYDDYWLAEPHMTELGLSRYIDLGGNGGCERR